MPGEESLLLSTLDFSTEEVWNSLPCEWFKSLNRQIGHSNEPRQEDAQLNPTEEKTKEEIFKALSRLWEFTPACNALEAMNDQVVGKPPSNS